MSNATRRPDPNGGYLAFEVVIVSEQSLRLDGEDIEIVRVIKERSWRS
jgi:hypothetical protein